ncbi:MAG TPA: DUF4365 domain-containing protein [Prosthecobacter sp.]|nr:DUF4365 domain-containing protein [Prosthecobacter sp.]
MTLVASVNHIYRPVLMRDEGIDGEIEFMQSKSRSSGKTYRVQLKSGDSHVETRQGGREVFRLKAHYEEHWTAKGEPEVLLIVRDGNGKLRYMNATRAIREAQAKSGGKAVKQIEFVGLPFDKAAVRRLREERLG